MPKSFLCISKYSPLLVCPWKKSNINIVPTVKRQFYAYRNDVNINREIRETERYAYAKKKRYFIERFETSRRSPDHMIAITWATVC